MNTSSCWARCPTRKSRFHLMFVVFFRWAPLLAIALSFFSGVQYLNAYNPDKTLCVFLYVTSILVFWIRFLAAANGVNFGQTASLDGENSSPAVMGYYLVVAYIRFIMACWLVVRLIDNSGQLYSNMRP